MTDSKKDYTDDGMIQAALKLLPERLRAFARARGLTQGQLAERLHIPIGTLEQYLKKDSQRLPNEQTLGLLKQYGGSQLFSDEEITQLGVASSRLISLSRSGSKNSKGKGAGNGGRATKQSPPAL